MSQAEQQLRHALEDLQHALAAAESVDPGVRERLDRAVEEIHAALARFPESPEGGHEAASAERATATGESVTGQLAGVAREFEASHPTLSGMVGSVIDALARMGI